ncbi:MAG TPA: hypothetical protein VI503_01115 [Gaiellaceae bacterium]|nr:hypothetical protein [Gaiellaceae bacterium]
MASDDVDVFAHPVERALAVECTVMRQALTRRKRRKARKLRERTGSVVEILFRRDIERLARRWRFPELARAARRADA